MQYVNVPSPISMFQARTILHAYAVGTLLMIVLRTFKFWSAVPIAIRSFTMGVSQTGVRSSVVSAEQGETYVIRRLLSSPCTGHPIDEEGGSKQLG